MHLSESQISQNLREMPVFEEAVAVYYGHLMSQVQQNLLQLEFLRALQSQQYQIGKFGPILL